MFLQIDIMTELMKLHLDEQNIVKFIGWYKIVFWTKVLVFEMLDMNLKDYCSQFAPLPLWRIRPIIQQVREYTAIRYNQRPKYSQPKQYHVL